MYIYTYLYIYIHTYAYTYIYSLEKHVQQLRVVETYRMPFLYGDIV